MDDHHFKQLEQETGWSKQLLCQLVENVTHYAIFVSDLDGRIVSWNAGAEKLFGYTAKEAIGQNCSILFSREDRDNGEPEKERSPASRAAPKTSAGTCAKTVRFFSRAGCKCRFTTKGAGIPGTPRSRGI